MADEVERVLEVARLHSELSPRLLAVKITDEEDFSISESTVYRILKENGSVYPFRLSRRSCRKGPYYGNFVKMKSQPNNHSHNYLIETVTIKHKTS